MVWHVSHRSTKIGRKYRTVPDRFSDRFAQLGLRLSEKILNIAKLGARGLAGKIPADL
jgi:hypothetical protein